MKKELIGVGTIFLILLISLNFAYSYAIGSKYEKFMRFFVENKEIIIQQIRIARSTQTEPKVTLIPSNINLPADPQNTNTLKQCVETGRDCTRGSDCCEDFLCIEGKCKSECEPLDLIWRDKKCSDDDQDYDNSGKACIFYLPQGSTLGLVLCDDISNSIRNKEASASACYESDSTRNETFEYGATAHVLCGVDTGVNIVKINSDICKNLTTLTEAYCDPNIGIRLKDITCPSGTVCTNGRCIGEAELPRCGENDGGKNIMLFGYAFLKDAFGNIVELYHDDCYYAGTSNYGISYGFVERYCDPNDPHVIKTSKDLCPPGYNCINGACLNLEPVECVDYDGGIHFATLSNVTKGDTIKYDGCIYNAIAVEYFCYNNEIQSARLRCEKGYSCVNGKCVDYPLQPAYGCTCVNGRCRDSNGADNINYCLDGKAHSFYCKSTNGQGQQVVPYVAGPLVKDCTDGKVCEQGYCIPKTNVEFICNETDFSLDSGGVNIYQKGTMYNQVDGKSYTDFCTKDSNVVEYSCAFSAGNARATDYRILKCEKGCQDGACIK
ncbi:MAG TPA: hypothetical protein PLX15_05440 [Candidatus Woesearchaeota archaeon]|mgnify:CR=1 FL=1|nr:hypothetical protein [Candidatus Woesearchaeota archaeon]